MKIHLLIPSFKNKIHRLKKRMSFYILFSLFPALSFLSIQTALINNQAISLSALILFTVISLMLALDASIEIKNRCIVVSSMPKALANLMGEFFPFFFAIPFAQIFLKDISSIGDEIEFSKVFGYQIKKDAVHVLQWMGSIWTVLIAYCVKYQWDAIISAWELEKAA